VHGKSRRAICDFFPKNQKRSMAWSRHRVSLNKSPNIRSINLIIPAARRTIARTAFALYDPIEHRPLATRFGQDPGVTILVWRSWAVWRLGYPEAALTDADRAIKDARDIGQAATLMVALTCAHWTRQLCGDYAAASALADELVALADEKGAALLKATGTLQQGIVFALTGKASAAIQTITSGMAKYQSTGATLTLPSFLPYLSGAYAELGQVEDAWRCIGEAMTAIETTGERWSEAEVNRVAGEIALKSPRPYAGKAQEYFERALVIARQQQAILGTPRVHEPRTSLARPGKEAASARTVGSGLRVGPHPVSTGQVA
jgi:predicted ATPase